jgi:hypothetical protein
VSATITVERNFPALDDMTLVTAEDLREIGLLVREQIIRRTRQGLDANGAPFQGYSPRYALQKEGRLGSVFAGHGGYGTVNLTVSGNMLNQIVITEVDDESVTLGWTQ